MIREAGWILSVEKVDVPQKAVRLRVVYADCRPQRLPASGEVVRIIRKQRVKKTTEDGAKPESVECVTQCFALEAEKGDPHPSLIEHGDSRFKYDPDPTCWLVVKGLPDEEALDRMKLRQVHWDC